MNAKVGITVLGSSPDSKLIVATGHIVDSMTGNTSYPTPVPALATIVAARNSYVTAVRMRLTAAGRQSSCASGHVGSAGGDELRWIRRCMRNTLALATRRC